MPTPAERIYEAIAGELTDQQSRAARLTSAVAPVGATATAGALLLEPATDGIGHAQWLQVAGLALGIGGLLLVLVTGAYLLYGADLKGVSPELLYQTATAGDSLAKSDTFHLAAAADLRTVRERNKRENKHFVRLFRVFVAGLVIELVGLGGASLARSNESDHSAKPPVAASLHLTNGRLTPNSVGFEGELARTAQGRVRITVSLAGRTGRVISLHPAIHDGRFRVSARVPRSAAPARSATYTVAWAGSASVAAANLAGTLARCTRGCR
jgi:hypothetical protein